MKLYMKVFTIYIISVVVREVASSSFFRLPETNINRGINGTASGLFVFEGLEDCATSCLRVTDCVFVNYDSQMKLCVFWIDYQDFFDGEPGTQSTVLVDMNDWKQVMKNDPCSNKPCGSGQRCIPNRSSYVCEEFCSCCNVPYFLHGNAYHVTNVDSTSHISGLILTSPVGWVPDATSDSDPYIYVDFRLKPFIVKGIVTRGDERRQGWITRYTVLTSENCRNFYTTASHSGNEDAENALITYITPPIITTCMNILIDAYENVPALKMDLVGCFV